MDSTTAPQSSTWLTTLDALPLILCNVLFKDVGSHAKKTVCWIVSLGMLGLLLGAIVYVLRLTKWNHRLVTYTGIIDRKDLVDEPVAERNHKRAKFLVRESARLVASALAKRETNLLDAYEDAAQAAVLARTAKEIDDDVSRLTEDLGVDFHEYLSYTATVLQDVRTKVRRGG